MRINRRNFAGVVSALALAVCLLAARPGAAARMTTSQAEDFDPSKIKRVAFIPFAAITPAGDGLRPLCPLTKKSFDPCRIEDAAEAELSRIVGRALPQTDGVTWVTQAEINLARETIKKRGAENLAASGSWQLEIGKEVHADAILFGFIYCYKERSGNAYASSSPAAVGFCLHLVEPTTNKVLWTFYYQDEQIPLFDNLLEIGSFIKRKGKWITVEAMAGEAAAALENELPWQPPAQEKKAR